MSENAYLRSAVEAESAVWPVEQWPAGLGGDPHNVVESSGVIRGVRIAPAKLNACVSADLQTQVSQRWSDPVKSHLDDAVRPPIGLSPSWPQLTRSAGNSIRRAAVAVPTIHRLCRSSVARPSAVQSATGNTAAGNRSRSSRVARRAATSPHASGIASSRTMKPACTKVCDVKHQYHARTPRLIAARTSTSTSAGIRKLRRNTNAARPLSPAKIQAAIPARNTQFATDAPPGVSCERIANSVSRFRRNVMGLRCPARCAPTDCA